MRFRLSLSLVACIVLGPLTFASADGPNYPKPPKPDFSSMQFLVGTWSCSSKSARRPSAVASTQTFSLDPTGYYLVLVTKQNASPWFPYTSTATDKITYDSELKKWADIQTDTFGGYGLNMSSGWSGGKLVWHPVNNTAYLDVASSSDYTITKVSDTKLSSASSFTTKTGKTVGVAGTCRKT